MVWDDRVVDVVFTWKMIYATSIVVIQACFQWLFFGIDEAYKKKCTYLLWDILASQDLDQGMINLEQFKNMEEYLASLSKSPRRNLTTNPDNTLKKHGITLTSTTCDKVGWEHFWILVNRQTKQQDDWLGRNLPLLSPKLWFDIVSRWTTSYLTWGVLDEYRDRNGRLLAWHLCFAKGDILVLTWHYIHSDADKYYIWFNNVRNCVQRAIDMKMKWVNYGPRIGPMHARYGFIPIHVDRRVREQYSSCKLYCPPFCNDAYTVCTDESFKKRMEAENFNVKQRLCPVGQA